MTTTDHEAIGNNPRTERRKPNRRTRRRQFRAHGAKLEAAGSHVLQPDIFAGVINWRRFHRRVKHEGVIVKNPERHLHSHARRRAAAMRALGQRRPLEAL